MSNELVRTTKRALLSGPCGCGDGGNLLVWILSFINPLSTRPHQNVVWYNNSWLGFLKIQNYVPKEREIFCDRNYFRQNNLWILKLATYTKIEDHYSRCKLATFLDWKGLPNVHILFCLHKTFKFYWFVMKIKKFMLPIWWYNRGSFPCGNKYFGVFVLNGIKTHIRDKWVSGMENNIFHCRSRFHFVTIYRWMWIKRVQWASAQFEILNGRLGPALDPKPCALARWTCSIRNQLNDAWKWIGGVINEMLVSMPQTC